MTTMRVELVAPDREVWAGEATMVIAKTTEGDIGVLPGHQPTLGVLVEGVVRIQREAAEELRAAVHGGFLSVSQQGVTVLAEVVELASEIDVSRAREALQRVSGAEDESGSAAARRAQARLRATGESA